MVLNERDSRHEQALQIGKQMMVAARTAPKAKGVDIIEVALITDEDIRHLSEEMRVVCEENGFKFFLRDADNIMEAECVLLIGTHELPHGLNCGHCGYATCANRPADVPCTLNSVDVGIAIGSACSIAADHRVDTRVMFSAGQAALQLNLMPECSMVLALPLSVSGKSVFFDRK